MWVGYRTHREVDHFRVDLVLHLRGQEEIFRLKTRYLSAAGAEAAGLAAAIGALQACVLVIGEQPEMRGLLV